MTERLITTGQNIKDEKLRSFVTYEFWRDFPVLKIVDFSTFLPISSCMLQFPVNLLECEHFASFVKVNDFSIDDEIFSAV